VFLGDDPRRPERLVVRVVLPGRGIVRLGPIKLVHYGPGEDPLMPPGQWWSDRQGGWLGALSSAAFGCLAGLVGLLAGRGPAELIFPPGSR